MRGLNQVTLAGSLHAVPRWEADPPRASFTLIVSFETPRGVQRTSVHVNVYRVSLAQQCQDLKAGMNLLITGELVNRQINDQGLHLEVRARDVIPQENHDSTSD